MQQFCCMLWQRCEYTSSLCHVAQMFLWRRLQSSTSSVRFFYRQYVFLSKSSCHLNWNLLLKTLSHTCSCFLHGIGASRNFCSNLQQRVQRLYVPCVSLHKSAIATTYQSCVPHNLFDKQCGDGPECGIGCGISNPRQSGWRLGSFEWNCAYVCFCMDVCYFYYPDFSHVLPSMWHLPQSLTPIFIMVFLFTVLCSVQQHLFLCVPLCIYYFM